MPKTNEWNLILKEEFQKEYFQNLIAFLNGEYASKTVYPPSEKVFNAFRYTPYSKVRVVILGQDPYHEPGQAEGLAFSVSSPQPKPPSLQNIIKEIEDDIGGTALTDGSLIPWARQGVLLLNTVLTVERGRANSHQGRGWEIFTDAVIRKLNEREDPIIFLLWGRPAGAKASLITAPQHRIFTAPHPSPLSAHRGFFGCKHFSKVNAILNPPIIW